MFDHVQNFSIPPFIFTTHNFFFVEATTYDSSYINNKAYVLEGIGKKE